MTINFFWITYEACSFFVLVAQLMVGKENKLTSGSENLRGICSEWPFFFNLDLSLPCCFCWGICAFSCFYPNMFCQHQCEPYCVAFGSFFLPCLCWWSDISFLCALFCIFILIEFGNLNFPYNETYFASGVHVFCC